MLRRASFLRRDGFTTIEAMVAAVVFLLGLAGLLGALVQARNATGQARRLLQASDIANDLAEQIQLWRFDDPRLADTPGPCQDDPMDDDGVLLHPGTGPYTAYRSCMHDETTINQPGYTFGGLKDPVFADESNNLTRYERFYIVRTDVEPSNGARRIHIWVKVLYKDAGEPRVVGNHTMRVQMGGQQ
jgi:type II secretory pathway pseudopilin PulG